MRDRRMAAETAIPPPAAQAWMRGTEIRCKQPFMATEQKPPARLGRLTERERRAARQAEQLRANLRRRKPAPPARSDERMERK